MSLMGITAYLLFIKSAFSTKGKWLGAETKMIYNNLPAEVKDGFMKTKYAA